MQMQLETINVCNARCCFCPYPKMTREKGTMDMGLFYKIIDEATKIPLITHTTLTGLGEPMLDPHVYDRVKYIRKKMGAIPIDIYTNGSRLDHHHVRQLSEAGLTTLYVSLNAVSHKQREDIMGLQDYERVVANVQHAIKHAKFKVVVKGVAAKDLFDVGDNETFMDNWGGAYDSGGNAFLHLEGNWAGTMWPMRRVHTNACSRALNQIMVLWDGRVSLCCFDGEGEVIFGDLNRQTIREVYNSEEFVNYRLAHVEGRRDKLKLCATCTAI